MKNRAIHLFIFLVIACSMAVGQYKEENRIVALSKYYLKPLRTVEDGSGEERREVFDEHAKKIITFPCDQHLNEDQLKYIVEVVRESELLQTIRKHTL